jgi:threonine dehydrogenase-like Zn-dependent dehydrogenase
MLEPFDALELSPDGDWNKANFQFFQDEEGAWSLLRNAVLHEELGKGLVPLRVERCGVCATDLARKNLPFPLPQVIGHEVLARDTSGQQVVIEINASHRARGLEVDCPYCQSKEARSLHRHCPQRQVLGIDRLPGGFGPLVLAPKNAIFAVPPSLPPDTAVLCEPFAAALHAVDSLSEKHGKRVAVLGLGRLGLLVIAALAARRRDSGEEFEILGLGRRKRPMDLALELGADSVIPVEGEGENITDGLLEIVLDTTGSPKGFRTALRIASSEVHLKSTHGLPTAGIRNLTAFVVDELRAEPFRDTLPPEIETLVWLAKGHPPSQWKQHCRVVRGEAALTDLMALRTFPGSTGLPGADIVVVDRSVHLDQVIRPIRGRELSMLRPGGRIWIRKNEAEKSSLFRAVDDRRILLSSSRCGDFEEALALLAEDPSLKNLGECLVDHHFSPDQLHEAFAAAVSLACTKAVIRHRDVFLKEE